MIIVLKPRTTKDDVSRVENMVKKRGLDTHIVQGREMTVIGCIGDTANIDSKLFEIDSAVDKVMHVQEPYKLANRAFHPEDSIIICLSGRGDKDVAAIARYRGRDLHE